MADQPEKRRFDTGTIVLLAVLGILAFWVLRGCGHGPFYGGWWDWDLGDLFFPSWGFRFLGFGLLIQIVLAVWVGLDAGKRKMSGILWGLLVFFTGIVGLLVYAIVCTAGTSGAKNGAAGALPPPSATPPPPGETEAPHCRLCRSPVRAEFKVCPYCGTPLRRNCPGCGIEVEPAWKVCPQCSADLEGEVPPAD